MAPNSAAPDPTSWLATSLIAHFFVAYEAVIVNYVPLLLILGLFPPTLYHYTQRPIADRTIPRSVLQLPISCILVGIELTGLVLRAFIPAPGAEETVSAATPDVFAAVMILAMARAASHHAIRAPRFLSLYFVLGIALNMTNSVCFSHRGRASLGHLAAAAAIARATLLVIEELGKRDSFGDDDDDIKQVIEDEIAKGRQRRPALAFLSPLFFFTTRPNFSLHDLFNLGPELSSKVLYVKLRRTWDTADTSQRHSLARCCLEVWENYFIASALTRAVVTVLYMAQPFLLRELIAAVGQETKTSRRIAVLLLMNVLIGCAKVALQAISSFAANCLSTAVRGGLMTMAFAKHQKLHIKDAKESTGLTTLQNDIDHVASGIPESIRVMFVSLETLLSVYVLSFFVGSASLAMLLPLLSSGASAVLFRSHTSTALAAWNNSLQRRVDKISRTLPQITSIKMIGLGPLIMDSIKTLRNIELGDYKHFRRMQSVSILARSLSRLMTPVIIVSVALFRKILSQELPAADIFPALSLIALNSSPFAELLQEHPGIVVMLDSFNRVQSFLCSKERVEPRMLPHDPVSTPAEIGPSLFGEEEEFSSANDFPSIQFQGVTIRPHDTRKSFYNNINISLYPGSITALVGSRGSGKTTLLESMLGETEIKDGFMYVEDDLVGFCGQVTYLQNASIRANVTGPLPFDPARFKRVTYCCLLQDDLKLLPGGDGYVVGIGGNNLSGCQRQKVALARALYADPSVILLDDLFASLDRRTAASILLRLCGDDGILRRKHCTVIFTTYLAEAVDVADSFIVLDKAQGDVKLMRNTGQRSILDLLRLNYVSASESVEQKQQEFIQRTILEQKLSKLDAKKRKERPRPGVWSILRFILKPVGVTSAVVWCMVVFLSSAGEVLSSFLLHRWADLAQDNTGSAAYLATAVLACFSWPVLLWSIYGWLSPNTSAYFHEQLMNMVMQSTPGFLGATNPVSILQRFKSLQQLDRFLALSTFGLVYYASALYMQWRIIFPDSKYATSAFLAAVFAIRRSYTQTCRQLHGIGATSVSPLETLFQETTGGVAHIRALRRQSYHFEQGLHLIDVSQKVFFYDNHKDTWLECVTALLSGSAIALFSRSNLFTIRDNSPAAVGLCLYLISILHTSIYSLVKSSALLDKTWGVLSDLLLFIRDTPRETEPAAVELPQNWPTAGKIEFRDVSARYSAGMPDILQNVSLSIAAGEKVSLFGRTGSGKTTLLLALLGFLDYTGRIEIDDVDIATIPRDLLRSRVMAVSQDPVELDGTIRSNLLPYEPAPSLAETKAEIQAAALELDDKLKELLADIGIWQEINDKGGLYANLQDAGLAKATTQTLCFARAVIRYHRSQGQLAVLDEATNGLNLDQDTAVQRSIWEFFEGCTILQVAHLEASTEDSELSVEIADGQIAHTRRGPEQLPGVVSRSREVLSPESMIMSTVSERESFSRATSPEELFQNHTIPLESRYLSQVPAMDPIAGEVLRSDEHIITLRDRMLSPRREVPLDADMIPPGAHRVASTYCSTSPSDYAATEYGGHVNSESTGDDDVANEPTSHYSESNFQGQHTEGPWNMYGEADNNAASPHHPAPQYDPTSNYKNMPGHQPALYYAQPEQSDQQASHDRYDYVAVSNYMPTLNSAPAPDFNPMLNSLQVPHYQQQVAHNSHGQMQQSHPLRMPNSAAPNYHFMSNYGHQPGNNLPVIGPILNNDPAGNYGSSLHYGLESGPAIRPSYDSSSHYSGSSYDSGSRNSVPMVR